MKRINILSVVLLLFFMTTSCGAQKRSSQSEIYNVIKEISDSPIFIREESFYSEVPFIDENNWSEHLSLGRFMMLVSLKIDLTPQEIKDAFSKEDLEHMREQAVANKDFIWQQQYLGEGIKVVDNKSDVEKVVALSYPVFSLDGKYAVVRVESTSGNLSIFRKENEKWEKIAIVSIWIS